MSNDKRGAKKGENRFAKSQQEKVQFRLKRIQDLVVPTVKTICLNTYFKNVTAFRKACANIYNENLPIENNKISYRTIARAPYWNELGIIYYSYFSEDSSKKSLSITTMSCNIEASQVHDSMVKTAKELQCKIEEQNKQIELLESTLLNSSINPLAHDDKGVSAESQEAIANLMATINWLLERTDGFFEINKEAKKIIDLSDDINGILDTNISHTYFALAAGDIIK